MSHRKNVSSSIALLLSLIVAPHAHAQSAALYEAMLSDGTRVEGSQLTGWHDNHTVPQLENVRLLDEKRQLVWFRNRSVSPPHPNSNSFGLVEFLGGDRLVGRVVSFQPESKIDGANTPHLLIELASPMHLPSRKSRGRFPSQLNQVRVLPDRIQRVVWGPTLQRRLRPGTLFYHGGGRLVFRRLRWKPNSVMLLLENGTREVQFLEITEIHLPQKDPWQAYFDELTLLSPGCKSRLLRIETTKGLIATASGLRFHATPYASEEEKTRAISRRTNYDKVVQNLENQRTAHEMKLKKAQETFSKISAELKKQVKSQREAAQKKHSEIHKQIDKFKKQDAKKNEKKIKQLEQRIREADVALQQQLAKQQKQEDQFKRKIEGAVKGWENYLKHLESVKRQRDSAGVLVQGTPKSWHHMVQPVWSLDPLWVPFSSIHTRWSFAPEQVPLSRVYPTATVSRSFLGVASPWHADRNSAGGFLQSGSEQFGWGFGVHAYSELQFTLPRFAKSFRSRLGLDSLVGTGGCVRVRVYEGSIQEKPLYESSFLIGSAKTVETGKIPLQALSNGQKRLVLQVDPAHRDRPRGADPLDIRDQLDWLDPLLELDKTKLQDEVHRQISPNFLARYGWTLALDPDGVYTWTTDFADPNHTGFDRFLNSIQAKGKPLILSRTMTIGPEVKWLVVEVSLRTADGPRPKSLVLRVEGQEVQPQEIPDKQLWQKRQAPLLFPLEKYHGKTVTLKLTQPADGQSWYWRTMKPSDQLPQAYNLARFLKWANKKDLFLARGLGLALQSSKINDQEKLALIDIYQLGGIVNYWADDSIPQDKVDNVLIDGGWTGGEESLSILHKVPSLKSLILIQDAGISSEAIAKLQAKMPNLDIKLSKNYPLLPGQHTRCFLNIFNRSGKEVIVYWVSHDGSLTLRTTLPPNGSQRRDSYIGHKWEAHLDGKRISKCTATPERVWIIKLDK